MIIYPRSSPLEEFQIKRAKAAEGCKVSFSQHAQVPLRRPYSLQEGPFACGLGLDAALVHGEELLLVLSDLLLTSTTLKLWFAYSRHILS